MRRKPRYIVIEETPVSPQHANEQYPTITQYATGPYQSTAYQG